MDADIGAHRQFHAVEHEGLLTDFWGDAGRRRRDDHVDRFENLQHLRAIPAAEFLRAVDERRGNHGAGDQPVTHRRIEIVRPLAQAVEMQRRALDGGDDIGGGAGARGLRDFDHARRAERLGDAGDGLLRFRKYVALKISTGDGDPQAADVLRQQGAHRFSWARRARGVVRIGTLHRVVSQRQIVDAARERAEVIETRDKRE